MKYSRIDCLTISSGALHANCFRPSDSASTGRKPPRAAGGVASLKSTVTMLPSSQSSAPRL
eukprot:463555-Pyramimonas_sp.AAC.1